jgi:DNA-binding NarL/FixJ family response regulator
MSGVSLPVTRPIGRALVVANPSARAQPLAALQRLGYSCAEADDPYTGMLELCRNALAYRALIVSLASLFKEELPFIESVKRRFPHVEVWLTQTDGRHSSLAEAMRLGADGLLADDGLHRIAITSAASESATQAPTFRAAEPPPGNAHAADDEVERELAIGEPVLTADELRALLQEQPSLPPSGGE